MIGKKVIAYALGSVLVGCATVSSDQRVIDTTSAVTGEQIVAINNRGQVGTDTFYTATSISGTKYKCQFNGGDLISFGVIQHAKCDKLQ
jgi:hypothetical protein